MAEYSPLDSLLQTSQGIADRRREVLEEASQRKKNEFNPINVDNLVHIDGDTWGLKSTGQIFRAGTADPAEGYDTYEKDPSRYSDNPDQWRAHRRNYAKLTGKPEFLISKDEVAEYGRLQERQTAERMEALARDGRLQLRPTGEIDNYGRHIAEAIDLGTGQSIFDSGRESNANYDSSRNAERQIRDIFGGEDAQYRVDDRSIRQAATDQIGNLTSGALNMANDLLQAGSIITGARNEWVDEFFENNRGRVEKLKHYMVSDAQLQREGQDQRNAARNAQLYDMRKEDYLKEGLSDRAASIRAGTDEFIDSVRDMILNPGAILDKTVESLPYMIGVGLAGRAAVSKASSLLRKNTIKQVKKAGGTAEQAAASAAQYAESKAGKKVLSRISTATGVGVIGLTEGMSTGASVYSSVMTMSEEEAMQSEKYQALRFDQGLSHTEAKQVLAEEAFDQTFLTAVAVAGGASLITGAAGFESKLFTRMADVRKAAAKPAAKKAAKGGLLRRATGGTLRTTGRVARYVGPSGLKEAGEESIQSGSQEFLTQLAQFDAGVGDEPGAGIGRATGEGAVVGFASGAGARGLTGTAKAIGNTNLRTSGLSKIKRGKPGTRDALTDNTGSPGGSKAQAVNKTRNLSTEQAQARFDRILKRLEKTDQADEAAVLRRYHEGRALFEKVGFENLSDEQKAGWEKLQAGYKKTLNAVTEDIVKEGKPFEKLDAADREILQTAMEEQVPAIEKLAKNNNAVNRIYKQVKRTVELIENAQSEALETAGEFADIDKKYNEGGRIAREKMGRGLSSNGKPGLMGHYDLISEAIAKGDEKLIKERSEELVKFISSQRGKLRRIEEAIEAGKKGEKGKYGIEYRPKVTEAYYNRLRDEMADMVKVRDGLAAIAEGYTQLEQGEQATQEGEQPKGRKVSLVAEAPEIPPRLEGVVTPRRRGNEKRTEQGQTEREEAGGVGSERGAGTEAGSEQAASDTGSDQQPDVVSPQRRKKAQSQERQGSNAEQATSLVGQKTSVLKKRLAELNAQLEKLRTGRTYPVEAKPLLDEQIAITRELEKRPEFKQPAETTEEGTKEVERDGMFFRVDDIRKRRNKIRRDDFKNLHLLGKDRRVYLVYSSEDVNGDTVRATVLAGGLPTREIVDLPLKDVVGVRISQEERQELVDQDWTKLVNLKSNKEIFELIELGKRRLGASDFPQNFGWTIPTQEQLDAVVKALNGRSVVMPAAGLGLWALLLRNAGVKVAASDINPGISDSSEAAAPLWTSVSESDAVTAVSNAPKDAVLFLSWPEMRNVNYVADTLDAYKGTDVIYIGSSVNSEDQLTLNKQALDKIDQLGYESTQLARGNNFHARRDAVYLLSREGGGPAALDASLDSMTVPQLKAVAKERGLTGYSKLRKAELLALLREESGTTEESAPVSTEAAIFSDGDLPGALASIAANSENRLFRALATRLGRILQGREIAVITLDDNAFEAYMRAYAPNLVDASAAMLHDRQEIVMRNKYRGHENMEQAFLHEATHAAINGWMTRPKTTPAAKALHNRSQQLRNQILRELRKGARDNPTDSRWTEVLSRFEENQEEWITYAWSNPQTQEILREIQMSDTLTAWDKFLKVVKDILGLEGRTALSHVLAVSDKIFEQNKGQQGASPRQGATYTPSPEAVEQAREALEAEGEVGAQAEAQPERSAETEPEGPSAEDIARNDFWWDALRETQRLIAALQSGRLQAEEVAYLNSKLDAVYKDRLGSNTAAGALAQMETLIRENLNEKLPRTQQQTAELKLPEIIRLATEIRQKGTTKAANKVIQAAEGFDTEGGFARVQRWLLGRFDRPNISEFIRQRFAQIGLPVSVSSGFQQASKTAKSLITAVPNLHEVLANPDARRELYDALELSPAEEKAFETFRNFRNEFANAVNQAYEDLSGGKINFPDGNRIEQNPAYLLTDLSDVMDPAAVTAMAYEAMNWLAGDGQRLSNDADAIRDILGLPDDHDLNADQKRLTTAGTLRRNVVSSLGRAAYRHLNIKAKQSPDVTPNLDERMEQALGTLAVRALIVANRLEAVVYEGQDFAAMQGEAGTEKENTNIPVNFVRIMSEGRTGRDRFYHSDANADLIDDSRPGRTVFTRLFGVSSVVKEPLLEVPTEDNIPKKALRSLMKVSKSLHDAIKNTQEQAWVPNMKMIETLSRFDNIRDFLAAGHDYKLNMNEVHATEKDAVEARNRTLEQMIENAEKWANENGTDPFYLTYFVTKTGRTNVGSTFINPQSSKIHRFLFRMKAWNAEVPLTGDNTLLNNFKIAVALGMDFKVDGKGVDKLTQDEVLAKFDAYMDSDPVREALGILAREGSISLQGAANKPLRDLLSKSGTHTLGALLAWQDYVTARDSGAKSFETDFPMEVDGVTNGFAAGLLQTPPIEPEHLERIKDLSRATGMYFDDDTVRSFAEWLRDPTNRDNYQEAARLMGENLRRIGRDPNVSDVMAEGFGPTIQDLQDPKVGRDFAKNPLMIIAYGAGFASVRRNKVEQLMQDMYNELAATSSEPDNLRMNAILNVLNRAVRVMNAGQRMRAEALNIKLHDYQIKEEYTAEDVQDMIDSGDIVDRDGNKITDTAGFAQHFEFGQWYDKDTFKNKGPDANYDRANFRYGLDAVYGAALQDSLQKMLAGIREVRDSFNHAVMLMNAIFREEFDRRVRLEELETGRVVGREQRSRILTQMHREGLVPSIRTAYSQSLEENLELTAYEHDLLPDEAVKIHHPAQRNVQRRTYTEEGQTLISDTTSTTSRLTTRTPSMDVGVAGIVGTIHSLDGTNSADVFGRFNVLNVFDAWVMSIADMAGVPGYGNQRFAQQHREYDLGQELLTSMRRMMLLTQDGDGRLNEAAQERIRERLYNAMDEARQIDRSEDSQMPDDPDGLFDYVSQRLEYVVPLVTEGRNRLFGSMVRSNQFSHDKTAYELTEEERNSPLPKREQPEDYVQERAANDKINHKAATLANNLTEEGNFHNAFFDWLQKEAVRPREALRVLARTLEFAGMNGADTISDLLALLHEHLEDSKIIKVGKIPGNDTAPPELRELGSYSAGEITLDESAFTEEDNPLETLLHEIIHAATDQALVDLEENNPDVLKQLNAQATKLFTELRSKKNRSPAEENIYQVLAFQDDTVIRVGEYLAWTLSSIRENATGDFGLVFNNPRVINQALGSLGQALTRGNRRNPVIRSSYDKVNNQLFDAVEEQLLESDKLWQNMDAMEQLDAEQDIADASDYRSFISRVMDEILLPGMSSLDVQTFLQLAVETDGTKNLGEVERASDRNILRVQAAGRKLNHNGGMSNQEVFAHELFHAVTEYVLAKDTKVRAELRKLYEQVSSQVTWEDFMPPADEQAGDIAAIEAAAKAAYDYVFGPPKKGVDQLQEFAALGLTNKAFALKLTQLDAPRATEPLWDGNILSFFVNLISRGLELLRSERLGTRRALNANDALHKLSQRVVTINQQAQARSYDKNGHRAMWRNRADAAAANRITALLDRAQEKLRLTEEEKAEDGSVLRWVRMGTHAALAQRTDAQQRANAEFLRHMGVNKSSDLAQAITEILPYNKDDRGGADGKIGFLDLLRKSKVEIDIARQRQIEHTSRILMDHFDKKRPMSKAERLAMTNVIFRTDLDALLANNDQRTFRDLHQMLNNPALVTAERNRLEREMANILARQNQSQLNTLFNNQIDSLGTYMTTGKMGHRNGMKNAYNIVNQFMLAGRDQVELSQKDELIAIVDQLASLDAIQKTSPNDMDLALRVINHEMERTEDNGFPFTLGLAGQFKRSALEDLFGRNPVQMRKGYVYDMTDGDINLEVIIDTPENRQKMEDLGMVEIGPVDRDKFDRTSTGKRVLYKGYRGANTWQKSVTSLRSRQHQGTNLFEVSGYDPKQTRYALGQMKGRNAAAVKQQFDANFKQDPRETLAIPVLDDAGNIVDYTYEMPLSARQSHLKNARHNDYFDQVLPRMFGSIADKTGTLKINSEVAKLLRDEWEAFKDSPEHAFVLIGKNSPDKRGRDMYAILPEEMKRELNQLFKGTEFADGFPIRDDAVNLVLGFRKLSILDLPSGRGDGSKFIRGQKATFAARTAEKIWHEIMQLVRIKMAIINPTVVIGNLSSNFGILLAEGIPVRYITTKTSEAIRAMRQYQRDIREIDTLHKEIGARKTLGQNSDALVRRRERLIAEISRNPVAKLVEEGLFTSIVEDVTSQEDTYREWVLGSLMDKAKGPLPGKAVQLAKEAYMVPGSTAFNMAIAATQYGDFIGRYVKYQYEVNVKGTPKRDAINGALASFIYYDMPQNRWLQYLNDNGFMMFTKFFLRIQPVVARLFQENPVKATGVLLAQQALMGPFDENIGTFALFQGAGNRFEPLPFRHIEKLAPTEPSLFQWLWPFGL